MSRFLSNCNYLVIHVAFAEQGQLLSHVVLHERERERERKKERKERKKERKGRKEERKKERKEERKKGRKKERKRRQHRAAIPQLRFSRKCWSPKDPFNSIQSMS